MRGHLPGLYTQRRGVRSQPSETDPPESLAIHEEGGGGFLSQIIGIHWTQYSVYNIHYR